VKNKEPRDDLSVIGRRLRVIRQARDKPIEVIAGLAGISTGKLSGLERGLGIPSIRDILALADVLEIAPSDLMRLPFPAPGNGHTDACIQAVRLAVMGAVHGYPGGQVVAVEKLRSRVHTALTASWRCDQPNVVGDLLPALIKDLYTTIAAGRDVPELLDQALLLHYHATLWWLRVAGASLDLRAQVTALMTHTALERGTPPALALAAGGGIHVAVLSGAMDMAWAALDSVPALPGDHESLQVSGSMMLARSWVASVADQRADATAALDAATELAHRTGQGNAFGLAFGPIEVAMWRVLALIEVGDHEQAVAVAETMNRDAHPLRSRQANAWVTYARALAGVRGRHKDAVTALKRAEEIHPLEVQRNQRSRDLLAKLVTTARHDAVGVELRRMVYRAGLTV
jgi:hypothetical protein